jgi:WD40 repeat protein
MRKYHAFISYRHASEGVVAPLLARALQQFAKPWHKMRALEVYRDTDDQNLSPNLKKAVEDAMDGSDFLILLASPGAVTSNWVPKELQYWLDNNDVEKLLIVVCEGEVVWHEQNCDFDWEKTTALPKVLSGHFDGEPLYLDLREFREEDQLSLQSHAFRERVARLSATLRGVSVEDVIGEEIRQFRKTRRIRNTALATFATLAVAATLAALYAREQRKEAVSQRNEAVYQRDQAVINSLVNEVKADLQSESLLHAVQVARAGFNKYGVDVQGRRALWEIALHPAAMLRMYNDVNADSVQFSLDGKRLLFTEKNDWGSADLTIRDWMGITEGVWESVFAPSLLADGRLHVLWPAALMQIAGVDRAAGELGDDSYQCENSLPRRIDSDAGAVVVGGLIDLESMQDINIDDQTWFGTDVHVCGDHLRLFSADGKFENVLRAPGALSGILNAPRSTLAVSFPGVVMLMDREGREIAMMQGANPVFSADGALLATSACDTTSENPIVPCATPGSTALWTTRGELLARFPGMDPQFALRGLLTTQTGPEGSTSLWELEPGPDGNPVSRARFRGVSPVVSADGEWVITGPGDLYEDPLTWVWNREGELLAELPGRPGALSPTRPVVATIDYRLVRLYYLPRLKTRSEVLAKQFVHWSEDDGELLDPCKIGCEVANDYSVEIQEPTMLSSTTPGRVPQLDSAGLKLIIEPFPPVGNTPEGELKREWIDAPCLEQSRHFWGNRLLIVCGYGEGEARIYDLDQPADSMDSEEQNASLVLPLDAARQAWFSPDGDYVLGSADNGTVRLWDIREQWQGGQVPFVDLWHEVLIDHSRFSTDSWLIATMEEVTGVRLWNMQGQPLAASPTTTQGQRYTLLQFTDEGRRLLVGRSFSIDKSTETRPTRGEFAQSLWDNHAGMEFQAWITDVDLLLEEFDWIPDLPEEELEDLELLLDE